MYICINNKQIKIVEKTLNLYELSKETNVIRGFRVFYWTDMWGQLRFNIQFVNNQDSLMFDLSLN
jgi:hypothetical protein